MKPGTPKTSTYGWKEIVGTVLISVGGITLVVIAGTQVLPQKRKRKAHENYDDIYDGYNNVDTSKIHFHPNFDF